MKRMILIAIGLFATLTVLAQSGFQVNPVFDGKLVPKSRMEETFIEGSQLSPYKLRVFRSVKFTVTESEFSEIQTRLLEDARGAADRQTDYAGGKLCYAVLRFPVKVRSTRNDTSLVDGSKYLCLQAARKGDGYQVTLVYMSGDATLEDLKTIFAN